MKFSKRYIIGLVTIGLAAGFQSCDDDEESRASFDTIFASYDEAAGTGEINIPISTAGVSASDLSYHLSGTATEGEDFEIVSFNSDGMTIRVLDDEVCERDVETLQVRLDSESGAKIGNNMFTLNIASDYDAKAYSPEDWDGFFFAREIYAPDDTYGPYDVAFEQDETDPNKFWTDNFWDSGLPAYVVFDQATGTVSFPTQTPLAGFPTRVITTVTPGTFDQCAGSYTITVAYRGSVFDYEFIKN